MARKPAQSKTAGQRKPAPDEQNPIDAAFVQALYEDAKLQGDEAALRQRIAAYRTLVAMEHAVSVPKEYEAVVAPVRTPFARDTRNRVTAALTRDSPVAHVEPRDKTQPAKEAANIAERWTWATFCAMNKELGEDVIHGSALALTGDEESVVKVVVRTEAYATFPARGDDEQAEDYTDRTERWHTSFGRGQPFAWRVVDRLSMVFGDGEFGDDWAIEYGEYPRPLLAREHGLVDTGDDGLKDPKTVLGGTPKSEGYLRSPNRSVKMEYFDAETWAVLVDGRMVPGYPKPNPYAGTAHPIPYFRAKDPAGGVLYALLKLQPELDSALTMKKSWARLGAFPNPTLKPIGRLDSVPDVPLGLDGADVSPAPFEWRPGKMIQPPQGYEFGFLSPPPIGQDLDEHIRILRDLIDIAGIPSVLRGEAAAHASGYLENQLIAAASLHYKKLGEALERQFAQVGEFLWTCVRDVIDQEVYVLDRGAYDPKTKKVKAPDGPLWLGLTPKAKAPKQCAPISLLGPLEVKFRPVLPTDEQARAMIALQLVNAPKQLISKRFALEHYLQHEDPEGMAEEILVEDALASEPLKGIILQNALQEAGVPMPGAAPNPASGLVGPSGEPLLPPTPYPPGQAGAGMPAIPGLTQPMQPGPPRRPPTMPHGGGRTAGAFPGQPSNQGPAPTFR
jgi:hypothetical protein